MLVMNKRLGVMKVDGKKSFPITNVGTKVIFSLAIILLVIGVIKCI